MMRKREKEKESMTAGGKDGLHILSESGK